jgi:predicted DsbA family dithiol-disulfide isomerase
MDGTERRGIMTVEIWSDLICPWCSIGLARFDKALAGFPGRESVEVVHRAFRLAPGAKTEPVAQVIPRRYGLPPSKASSMFDRVEAVARGEGLEFHLARGLYGDTRDGHRLVQYAATVDRQRPVVERFYRAYFTEGTSLFDHAKLLDLAVEAGLDREAAREVLESDAFGDVVESDQRTVEGYGASGVPFYVIGGRYGVSGAQETEVFARALRQAWDDAVAVQGTDGDGICTPEGCATT